MQLTFFGTGNCAGIPVYNCHCDICSAARTMVQNRRRPCCAMLATPGCRLLIDAGVGDLGGQIAGETLDAILLTHYHIDHVHGLFTMRWGLSDRPIPVLGPDDPAGCADLLDHPGIFDFSRPLSPFITTRLGDLTLIGLPLHHSKPSLGFAIECADARLAWLCDTGGLPPQTLTFLQSWQPTHIVLDCTFPPLDSPHPNHNDILRAIELHQQIGSGQCYLTHIGHELDLWLAAGSLSLPANVHLARDELVLEM